MLKATRRCAVLLGLLALGVFVASMPSFAETQNVKVGGSVKVYGFIRDNLDLHQEGTGDSDDDDTAFFMQQTSLNVNADLTENASATLRLTNERDWNPGSDDGTGDDTDAGDIDLSQAYVTLKELFYSPLTLRVGTQPIVWGRGFILGSNLFNEILAANDRNASINANEFTDFTAFDAIRLTADLSGAAAVDFPLTIDGVYIKVDENSVIQPDDLNFLGVNVGTRLDAMNAELETYYINQRDKSMSGGSGNLADQKDGSVSTLGVRGSAQPAEGVTTWGELAYQFGKRNTDPAGILPSGDAAQAWAANLGTTYTLGDVALSPTIGGEWRFYSGKDINGAVGGWDPIAPGYFTTALREFQSGRITGFYPSDQTCFVTGTTDDCTAAASNQHELALIMGLKPMEDLSVNNRLSWFVLDEGWIPVAGAKRQHHAGTEWDTVVNYNYTEDVQLGVIYALFLPGSAFRSPNDSTAQELITTVGVNF